MYPKAVIASVLAAVLLFAGCSTSVAASRSADSIRAGSDEAASPLDQLSTQTTDHFVLMYDNDSAWAPGLCQLLEQVHRQFFTSLEKAGFSPRPNVDRLVWVCFEKRSDFDRYADYADGADMSWLDGYYSARTNRVVLVNVESAPIPRKKVSGKIASAGLNASGATGAVATVQPDQGLDITMATHEAAHQLAFNSGIQKRGVMYPFWASEGFATNFEADSATGVCGFGNSNRNRARWLYQAKSNGKIPPIRELCITTEIPVEDNRQTNYLYAEGWALFRFLFENHQKELRSYLENLAKLPPGRRDSATMKREFEAAFGPAEKLQVQWQQFVDRVAVR